MSWKQGRYVGPLARLYSQYVREACDNVRAYLKQRNGDDKLQDCKYHMPSKAPGPMSNDYRPKIDISPELNATDAA